MYVFVAVTKMDKEGSTTRSRIQLTNFRVICLVLITNHDLGLGTIVVA